VTGLRRRTHVETANPTGTMHARTVQWQIKPVSTRKTLFRCCIQLSTQTNSVSTLLIERVLLMHQEDSSPRLLCLLLPHYKQSTLFTTEKHVRIFAQYVGLCVRMRLNNMSILIFENKTPENIISSTLHSTRCKNAC